MWNGGVKKTQKPSDFKHFSTLSTLKSKDFVKTSALKW